MRLIAAAIGLLFAVFPAAAQSFDVASIRPSIPGAQTHFSAENGRLSAEGFSLPACVIFAWDLTLSRA